MTSNKPAYALNAKQAADALGVSKHTVYRMVKNKLLDSTRPTKGRILIPQAAVFAVKQ